MSLALYGFVAPKRRIEPAGISYEFSVVKDRLALGLSTFPVLRIAQQSCGNGTDRSRTMPDEDAELLDGPVADWMDKEDAKYRKLVARLDPNNWKEQDHYKVLGLSKLRHRASPAQIKTAYRRKVLKYHPDKGQAAEHNDTSIRNEAIFACIQKAYEQLGFSEERRRAFDSVDPTFDESVPETVEASDFFSVLGSVFARNARFSVNQPVPELGDENSDRSHVEHFYEFWFDWCSWREFSYLDAEDKSKGEDRWERREIEKMNKVEREKRRKKDLKRISTLVEMAYSKDPRVARFKDEDRRKKEAIKEQRRRERELREQTEQEERRREEEEAERERREREEQERLAAQDKQRKKKAMAAQRRRLRELAANSHYWVENGIEGNGKDQSMATMEKIEKICICATIEELNSLLEKLTNVETSEEALQLLNKFAGINESTNGKHTTANGTQSSNPKAPTESVGSGKWSTTELQLLVKAVNLYPPGTQERWKQVAEYVSYHGGQRRTERDVIKQVKLLKNDPVTASSSIKSEAEPIGSVKTTGQTVAKSADEGGWTTEQQKQLERALKEIPARDPERWEKIAEKVEGRNKKECIRRYKQLSEMVKQAKVQVQQQL